jgi:hypothetical protein
MKTKSLFVALAALAILWTSCAQEDITQPGNQVWQAEILEGADLEVFGDLADANSLRSSESTCDEWFIFRRDPDFTHLYRLAVTCYPYFAFDTVFASAPVGLNASSTESGSVGGSFHVMHANKVAGIPWRDAEPSEDFTVGTYVSTFSAIDSDLDGYYDVTFDFDGVTYTLPDWKVVIANRNDEDRHIYRVSFKVPNGATDDYFCIYWQDM